MCENLLTNERVRSFVGWRTDPKLVLSGIGILQTYWHTLAEIKLDSLRCFPNVVAERRSYAHDASDAMFRRTASLCLLFCIMRYDSTKCHILGVRTPAGDHDPQIRTRPRFFYNATTLRVSSSCVYSFGSYRVDTQTHKHTNKRTNLQTDAAENIQRSSLRCDVGYTNSNHNNQHLWDERRQQLLGIAAVKWMDYVKRWDFELHLKISSVRKNVCVKKQFILD